MKAQCKFLALSFVCFFSAVPFTPSFAQVCEDESVVLQQAESGKDNSHPLATPAYSTKKRITFLWDVTLSMYGKRMENGVLKPAFVSKDIYDKVQESIINQINSINNEAVEIVVIPFQEGVIVEQQSLADWTCESATFENKAKLIRKIRENKQFFLRYAQEHGANTDILGSLKWVTENIFDVNRTDILYLLTDGEQNAHGTKQKDLENYINGDWAGYALERNVHGFYLMLTKEAKKPSINQGVPLLTRDMSEIDEYPSSVSIQLKNTLSLNIKEIEDYESGAFSISYDLVGGNLPQGSKLTLRICNNPYLSLGHSLEEQTRIITVPVEERTIRVPYVFLKDQATCIDELPEKSYAVLSVEKFSCESQAEADMTMITPERIPINIINKAQPTLRIRWAY